jgi:5'-nucleotidase
MIQDKAAEPIGLFDMDGTLADFDGAIKAGLAKMRSPGEPEPNDIYGDEDNAPWMKERRRAIKQRPGFWFELEPLKLGFDVLQIAQDMNFTNHILSKGPAWQSAAWSEKHQWCNKYVPGTPIILAQDKGLIYGKMLCDDWPPYFMRWLEWRPRGLVVSVEQPWNKGIKHPNVVIYNGENIDEVKERMAEIRATAA